MLIKRIISQRNRESLIFIRLRFTDGDKVSRRGRNTNAADGSSEDTVENAF
jgi:hypothetical protein